MSSDTPLIERELDSVFARVLTSSVARDRRDEAVTARQFLNDVSAVATQLPAHRYTINLCANRYFFTVAFAATIVKGQTNLLPQNRTQATQNQLIEEYRDCCVVHDGLESISGHAPSVNIASVPFTDMLAHTNDIPHIPLQHLAAIAFTSGSTGTPKPNAKYWQTFVESTAINAEHMLPNLNAHYSCLATVPGQHMWGLETSVLMPMLSNADICDKKPLFPQDVADLLNQLPSPRILISTPVHLRALVQSGVQFPKLERVLCATAPLSPNLARKAEHVFKSDLIEVFGCSEVGSMARKRSALDGRWELFNGIDIISNTAHARHLPGPVALQDHFEFADARHFTLAGRNEDIIEIGGKRGSLLELNKILMECPGVQDGAVFMPEKENKLVRPAAVVAASDGLTKATIQEFFNQHLDPVFTPRPIYFVDTLPREENGKLKKEKLLTLFETLQKNVTRPR